MRARPGAAAALLTGLLLTTACAGDSADHGDTWAASIGRGAGELRVLYVPAPGFAYEDEAGRLTGVSVEIVRRFALYVAETHDVELRMDFVEEPDWQRFYDRVRDGRDGVLGLGNVTITADRRRELGFSPPYLTNIAVLITKDDVPELHRLEGLGEAFAGMAALAFAGTLHEIRLTDLTRRYAPDLPVAHAHSNAEILERVASGQDYFAYIDVYNFWRALEEGAPLRTHPVADQAAEEFGIIVRHGSDWEPVLAEFFNDSAPEGFRSSEIYRSILERHLGPELTEKLEAARLRTEGASIPD